MQLGQKVDERLCSWSYIVYLPIYDPSEMSVGCEDSERMSEPWTTVVDHNGWK